MSRWCHLKPNVATVWSCAADSASRSRRIPPSSDVAPAAELDLGAVEPAGRRRAASTASRRARGGPQSWRRALGDMSRRRPRVMRLWRGRASVRAASSDDTGHESMPGIAAAPVDRRARSPRACPAARRCRARAARASSSSRLTGAPSSTERHVRLPAVPAVRGPLGQRAARRRRRAPRRSDRASASRSSMNASSLPSWTTPDRRLQVGHAVVEADVVERRQQVRRVAGVPLLLGDRRRRGCAGGSTRLRQRARRRSSPCRPRRW